MFNLDLALADFNRAIELMPTQAIYHSNRAFVYLHMGRKQEALADVDAAIELDPKAPHAYYTRCWILMGMGRNDEAIEAINRGLELGPDDSLLRDTRREVLIRLQKYDEALADLSDLVKSSKSPRPSSMHCCRAGAAASTGTFGRRRSRLSSRDRTVRPGSAERADE